MFLQSTGRTHLVFLCLLLLPSCTWMPAPSDVNPQAAAAKQSASQPVTPPEETSATPPAHSPQVANAVEETEPEATGCNASKPGQIVGFDEFYAATLKGSEGERLYISTAPGAVPGDSYGLAGDSVEAIATALDSNCTSWTWVKWSESDYRGWLVTSSVELDRGSGRRGGNSDESAT